VSQSASLLTILQNVVTAINGLSNSVMNKTLTFVGIKYGLIGPGIPTIATGEIYYDNTGGYVERNAPLNIVVDTGPNAPSQLVLSQFVFMKSKGDNATFPNGVGAGFFAISDRSDVTALNKGLLYGPQISIRPQIARNNSPFDDATGLVIQNDGTAKATDAYYVGVGPSVAGNQWDAGYTIACNAQFAYRAFGTYSKGIDFSAATFTGFAFQSPGFNVDPSGRVVALTLATKVPDVFLGTSGTVTSGSVEIAASGTFTLTLPNPVSFTGQWLTIKSVGSAFAVNSASANVVPLAGGAAGTAIFPASTPHWCIMQSDGNSWITFAAA
jgi:hypothetical protein